MALLGGGVMKHRILKAFHAAAHRGDELVMERAVTPVAHWVDYRFHKNQFDCAAAVITVGIMLAQQIGLTPSPMIGNLLLSWRQYSCLTLLFILGGYANFNARASSSNEPLNTFRKMRRAF
jgi:hypothetical protein